MDELNKKSPGEQKPDRGNQKGLIYYTMTEQVCQVVGRCKAPHPSHFPVGIPQSRLRRASPL